MEAGGAAGSGVDVVEDSEPEGAKLEAQMGRLRRLVPGAEWKADVALALVGGDVARAGDLLFSGKSDVWWAEQRSFLKMIPFV